MKHFVWSTLISIHIVLFIAILEQHQPGLLFSPHARQEGAGWLEGESPHDLQLRVQHTYSAVVLIQKYCSNAMHPLGPQSQTKGWQQLSRKLSTFTICGYTCEFVLGFFSSQKQKKFMFQQFSAPSTKEINLQRRSCVGSTEKGSSYGLILTLIL